ncbi:sodium:solute symporter family protein [Flagellimonas pacifica]|uniref:Na+/proline symporter n=1 Tax=Flagellimonas pacifica TaxID=1247520 RepID=A0A285MQQ0_9FLAO|nr:sodium:solute symporter family protein [Allomuricauda parva]SNY99512.1 Na+/proline symporter [Allomuricauda parva]
MVSLSTGDLVIIIGFFSITLGIGLYVSKSAGKSSAEYFLSGRSMPWWLLGISMVATTFSTDTPNLVTDIVRTNGVSGNWVWWAFLLTGLSTVFIYAKLWRKSNVLTDMEFYELRYGGKPAKFLRGFRSVYLGLFFNIITLAAVNLAAIKIGGIMLGLSPIQTILIGGIVTVIFSAAGGFKGVVYTDFLLFFVAMGGAFGAAYYLVNLPEVGGMKSLMENKNVVDKLSLIPELNDTNAIITLLVIPLAVQWWSSWYPGAEPGGGGYIAQRMLATKNSNHAIASTFFFNIMHYALRPWPWIIVALTSLVVFPDLASIQEAFPNVPQDKLGHDLAYSAMLTKLPPGLLGLVLASLGAAYMSTISTQLNWGSSYLVNDFYKQYIRQDASEKRMVFVGRLSTLILMLLSAIVALSLNNAKQLFDILLEFGAGTGLVYILRWFWWRINSWSEISVMFSAAIISILFNLTPIGETLFGNSETLGMLPNWSKLPIIVAITTVIWLFFTFITKPESNKVLYDFYKRTQPGGPGWRKIVNHYKARNIHFEGKEKWSVPMGIVAMLVGCIFIYSALFATGYWIYGKIAPATLATVITVIFGALLLRIWKKIKTTVI